MTDRAQFEAMLEALINEDQATAKEIFHNIVVAKSREIYEELLAEDFDLSEKAEEEEEEESVEEGFGEEEDEGEEESDDEGEEPSFSDDDEESEEPSFGDEEEGEGDIEDRVLDLEDALEELRADFDQLMADEEGEPEHDDMFGGDDMGGDMGGMGSFGDEEPVDELAAMLEYVNAVAKPKHGDNGQNTKSIFNKPKYNDMGGVAPKFGGEAKGEGTKGGLLNPSTKEENFGNINVPGGKAGKSAFTHKEPGHGAEKKGQSEKADNKKSLISGKN